MAVPKAKKTTLAGRLRAELTKAQIRIFELEAERDRFGGAWSSAEHAASGYRHQRDEVVRALTELLEEMLDGPPPHSGPVRRAWAIMQRYRPRPDAMIGGHDASSANDQRG